MGLQEDLTMLDFLNYLCSFMNPTNPIHISSNNLSHTAINSLYMYEGMRINVDDEVYQVISIQGQSNRIVATCLTNPEKQVDLDVNSPRISFDDDELKRAYYDVWVPSIRPGTPVDFLLDENNYSTWYMGVVTSTTNKLTVYYEDRHNRAFTVDIHDISPSVLQKAHTHSRGRTGETLYQQCFPLWSHALPLSETNNHTPMREGGFSAGPILFHHTYPYKHDRLLLFSFLLSFSFSFHTIRKIGTNE